MQNNTSNIFIVRELPFRKEGYNYALKRSLTYCLNKKGEKQNAVQVTVYKVISPSDGFQSTFHHNKD